MSVKIKSPSSNLMNNKGNIKAGKKDDFIAELQELFDKKPMRHTKSQKLSQNHLGVPKLHKKSEVTNCGTRFGRRGTKLHSLVPFKAHAKMSQMQDLNSPDILAFMSRTNRSKVHSGKCPDKMDNENIEPEAKRCKKNCDSACLWKGLRRGSEEPVNH
ncbi:unnamed protein product [Moneuplotes crassus]|uniref:Uncharacterized protein n=1 Tax=Euplotes crassus TaxID=5936 RepID=A0AAD1XVL6_EUPCR|nr:unnamed protein product [Moneuplotes crassus]